MTRTARTLIISAAMAGLVAGTMATTGCKSDSSTLEALPVGCENGFELMALHPNESLAQTLGSLVP